MFNVYFNKYQYCINFYVLNENNNNNNNNLIILSLLFLVDIGTTSNDENIHRG